MTSFDKTADDAVKTEPKAEEPVVVLPPSKVKSDPILWREACEFADMLTFCRPHLCKTERKFIAKYLVPLEVQFDKKGNVYKKIGENPVVLWSSHIDTVHNAAGFQKIEFYHHKTSGELFFQVAHKVGPGVKNSSCLGADDTCGIWLMIQMIRANIPGLYIFHRGEECGGIGSKWIAENNKDAVASIKYAIAFDRRDEKSIITHQRSRLCCSDEFANSLAEQLGMGHKCDTGGSFTDTASYVDLVPECTNISAGYYDAHCKTECTNVDYLFRLRDALLKLDVSKLVEKRKPGENTWLSYSYSDGYYGNHNYGEWDGWEDRDWSSGHYEKGVWVYDKKKSTKTGGVSGLALRAKYKNKKVGSWLDDYEFDKDAGLWFPKEKTKNSEVERKVKVSYYDMVRMIRLNPEIIADILEQYGYDGKTLKKEMLDLSGLGQTIHL